MGKLCRPLAGWPVYWAKLPQNISTPGKHFIHTVNFCVSLDVLMTSFSLWSQFHSFDWWAECHRCPIWYLHEAPVEGSCRSAVLPFKLSPCRLFNLYYYLLAYKYSTYGLLLVSSYDIHFVVVVIHFLLCVCNIVFVLLPIALFCWVFMQLLL